jgi:hypothetical protein
MSLSHTPTDLPSALYLERKRLRQKYHDYWIEFYLSIERGENVAWTEAETAEAQALFDSARKESKENQAPQVAQKDS